jgi:DNA-binding response OmpR family regulator
LAKILIIDDEESIRRLYAAELGEEGYEVITIGTCDEALPRIDSAQPSVVILDIRMDDCHGLDLLQQVRMAYPDLPVMLNTAYDSFRDDVKSVAADDYLVKSYDLAELKAKLLSLLRKEKNYSQGYARKMYQR